MPKPVINQVQTKPVGFAPILAHYFDKCGIPEGTLFNGALEQQQRGPCPGPFATSTDGIVAQEDLVDAGPVNGVVKFIHEFKTAVVLD